MVNFKKKNIFVVPKEYNIEALQKQIKDLGKSNAQIKAALAEYKKEREGLAGEFKKMVNPNWEKEYQDFLVHLNDAQEVIDTVKAAKLQKKQVQEELKEALRLEAEMDLLDQLPKAGSYQEYFNKTRVDAEERVMAKEAKLYKEFKALTEEEFVPDLDFTDL